MRLLDAENSAVESALVRGLEAGSARKTILCGAQKKRSPQWKFDRNEIIL
ncbi:hypothetical protein ACTQ4Q_05300 [Bacillota bacterium LCP21S3_D9]